MNDFSEKYSIKELDDNHSGVFIEFIYRREDLSSLKVYMIHEFVVNHFSAKPKIFFTKIPPAPFPDEWRFFFESESKRIFSIASRDIHTNIAIEIFKRDNQLEITTEDECECRAFIDSLITCVRKDLKRGAINKPSDIMKSRPPFFFMMNTYYINYIRGNFLDDFSDLYEDMLKKRCNEVDARENLNDDEKEHLNISICLLGTHFASAIMHYFMALEGFINILFKGLMKKEITNISSLVGGQVNVEKYLENIGILEKLALLPHLCYGFKPFVIEKDLLESLIKLKNYRNHSIHSKINDNMTKVCHVWQGFLYTCDLVQDEDIPRMGNLLKKEHVANAKSIVDKIISVIFENIDEEIRSDYEKMIKSGLMIPFWRDEDGNYRIRST